MDEMKVMSFSKTAHVLFNETKKSDVVSRYGGDEFAILIPET